MIMRANKVYNALTEMGNILRLWGTWEIGSDNGEIWGKESHYGGKCSCGDKWVNVMRF